EGAQEVCVLLADRALGELREHELPRVHEASEVEPVLPLRHHEANELRAEERIQARQNRGLRIALEEGEFLREVVHDLRIANRRQERRTELAIDEEAAEIEERPALTALEEGEDRVPEDRRHLVAPTGREPAEDGDQVGGQKILF